jgi:RNA polymerase sigma factor (sigma-70 family)
MHAADSPTDEELSARLRAGDERAFQSVYETYFPVVYTFLYKFLKAELTEDITQELFMKVWNGRADLPQLRSVKSYLLTAAKNQAFNFLKRAGVDQHAKAEILRHYPTEGNSGECYPFQ